MLGPSLLHYTHGRPVLLLTTTYHHHHYWAQGVEAAAAEVACELGFPRTPSTAQVTGLPMTRSAASELAITLNDMMT